MLIVKQDIVGGPAQQQAFNKWKNVISSFVLVTYDARHDTIVTADASLFGFGALLQEQGNRQY